MALVSLETLHCKYVLRTLGATVPNMTRTIEVFREHVEKIRELGHSSCETEQTWWMALSQADKQQAIFHRALDIGPHGKQEVWPDGIKNAFRAMIASAYDVLCALKWAAVADVVGAFRMRTVPIGPEEAGRLVSQLQDAHKSWVNSLPAGTSKDQRLIFQSPGKPKNRSSDKQSRVTSTMTGPALKQQRSYSPSIGLSAGPLFQSAAAAANPAEQPSYQVGVTPLPPLHPLAPSGRSSFLFTPDQRPVRDAVHQEQMQGQDALPDNEAQISDSLTRADTGRCDLPLPSTCFIWSLFVFKRQ